MNSRRVRNIIEALGKHKDEDSIQVLNELGTNCPIDEIRELTAQTLIRKNTHESLRVVLISKGKGINDTYIYVAQTSGYGEVSETAVVISDTLTIYTATVDGYKWVRNGGKYYKCITA